MATWLKQSTSVDVPVGPFLDETDGKTAETALTITQPDIRLAKNAGAWAQKSGAQTLTHEENGWYEVALSTTDTDTLGILIVAIHEAGALPVWREFMVVPANVWDSYLGADRLQIDLRELGDVNLALTTQMKADVNAEVVDGLNVDTYAEPGQGAPGATISLAAKIGYQYKAWRNRHTQTASEFALYADNGTTKDQEAAVSDDGTTFDRSEITTGA